jgi:hypothetical protein
MKQSRRMSLVEALANVAVGFSVAMATQIAVFPLFGLQTSLADNLALGAIFTGALGRAWIASGQPRHRKTIGSFEGWSQVIGGTLEVAGVPGFLGNLREMYETADADGAIWRVFIAQ